MEQDKGLKMGNIKTGGDPISRIPHTYNLLWLLPSGPDLVSKQMLREDP